MFSFLFSRTNLTCKSIGQRDPFIYDEKTPQLEAATERAREALRTEVGKQIEWYMQQIDQAGDNPERLEQLLEGALAKLADKYKGDVDKARDAQKQALQMLVGRACDLNGNGKIDTTEERTLENRVSGNLSGVLANIDIAASEANGEIREMGRLAETMRREARGGVGKIEALADASDPSVRTAYGAYQEVKDLFNADAAHWGLRPGDNFRDNETVRAAIRRTTRTDATVERALEDEGMPALIARVQEQLKNSGEQVREARQFLLDAIDRWHKDAVVTARETYGERRVEARALAEKIDQTKVAVIAEAERAREVAATERTGAARVEAARASRDTTQAQLEAKRAERDATEVRLRAAEKRFRETIVQYGLRAGEKIDDESVREGIRSLARKGVDWALRTQEDHTVPETARQILGELQLLEGEKNAAQTEFKARSAEVAGLESTLGYQKERVARAETQAETDARIARETPREAGVRVALRGKAEREAVRVKVAERTRAAAARREAASREALRRPPEPEIARQTIEHTIKHGENDWTIARAYFGSEAGNTRAVNAMLRAIYGSEDRIPRLQSGGKVLFRDGDKIKIPTQITFTDNANIQRTLKRIVNRPLATTVRSKKKKTT